MRKKAILVVVAVIIILMVLSPGKPKEDKSGGQRLSAQSVLVSEVKSEDPSIVFAKDGSYRAVWFTEKDGDADLWTAKMENSVWGEHIKITSGPGKDYYPSITQVTDGRFHMVWFRITGTNADVWYANSTDGEKWTEPLQLTFNFAVDWTPTITERNGEIWMAWASTRTGNKDVFAMKFGDRPMQVTDDEGADDFPYVFAINDTLAMVWNKYEGAGIDQGSYPGSSIVYATSKDGKAWSLPMVLVKRPKGTDVFPSVYWKNGEYFLVWTSDRKDIFGDVYEAPISSPIDATRLTSNGYPDYSGRAAGNVLVWVADPKRNQKDLQIFYKTVG